MNQHRGSSSYGGPARGWIDTLCPDLELHKDLVAIILRWPETKDLPPVVIHLHSVIVHSIYRTFCKIGNKETIWNDYLLWIILLSFQQRAKTELIHANNSTRPFFLRTLLFAKP